MKRSMLCATFTLAAVALALTAHLAVVSDAPTGLSTTHDAVPDGLHSASTGTGIAPARAASRGFFPCVTWITSRPMVPGRPAVSLAPDGRTFGPFHAYSPDEICKAYGVDELHAEDVTGKGQTIVVVGWWGSPTALADLQEFSKAFGLPDPDLTIIYPNGKPTYNGKASRGQEASWAVETSLDLQWAHAIAPDAKLVMIAATGGGFSASSGFDGIAYAVQHYPGSVISQSFGGAEQSWLAAAGKAQTSVDPIIARYHKVYEQAIAAGCTVLAASGDWGTANNDFQGRTYPYPTVLWPASDPLVTACGGTQLQYGWQWTPTISEEDYWTALAVSGDWWQVVNDSGILAYTTGPGRTEVVWNEFCTPSPQATGGGLSALFPTPDFQSGLDATLLQGRRGVPDISWNAAGNGGVLVYMSNTYGWAPYDNGWALVGGTSASTPQIAGLIALANQLRSQNGKGLIGYLNPVLYTLPADDFNDIVPQTFGPATLDDNEVFGSDVPGFQTTRGYDLTTGLGSPKAYEFVHDLANAP